MDASLVQNPCDIIISEECIISDISGDSRYRRQHCHIFLYPSKLVLLDKHEKLLCSISMVDIVGARYTTDKSVVNLDVFHYPLEGGVCCFGVPPKIRKEDHLRIVVSTSLPIDNWVNALNALATNQPLNLVEDKLSLFDMPRKRKFVAYVNPHSGPGHSLHIWNKYVKHVFEEANIDVTLLITTHAKHACNHICNLDNLISFDGIVTIGGDGILAEIVEGIGLRSDAISIFKTVPLIPIPGGTSNGLVKSILYECNLDYGVLNMIFVAIKGTPVKLDMSMVTTKSSLKYRSFLMLGWGLISDIDILSERMRWMGEFRMYVAAVYFILRNHHYHGKISMLLSTQNNEQLIESDVPELNQSIPVADPEKGNEASGWVVIEGVFSLILIVQTTHVSKSMYSGPGVTLNNGEFIIYVVKGLGRLQLASLLLQFDSGEFVTHPKVQTYKVRAYRLEPLETEKGLFTMDGEVIEYGPIQSVIMPGYALTVKG